MIDRRFGLGKRENTVTLEPPECVHILSRQHFHSKKTSQTQVPICGQSKASNTDIHTHVAAFCDKKHSRGRSSNGDTDGQLFDFHSLFIIPGIFKPLPFLGASPSFQEINSYLSPGICRTLLEWRIGSALPHLVDVLQLYFCGSRPDVSTTHKIRKFREKIIELVFFPETCKPHVTRKNKILVSFFSTTNEVVKYRTGTGIDEKSVSTSLDHY